MADIDALTRLVPPPVVPFEAGDQTLWTAAEKDLGLTLPADLFELSVTYGSGWFRGSNGHRYHVANPCSKWFRQHVKTWQPTYAELKANGVYKPFPADMHPADPGLLCIGHGDGRIALFLSFRDRKPDGRVIALTGQELWLQVSSNFVSFFTSVLRGDVDVFGYPGATGGGPWIFEPNTPPDPSKFPLLLEAVALSDEDLVRTLVTAGADPNSKASDGGTPLCNIDEEPICPPAAKPWGRPQPA